MDENRRRSLWREPPVVLAAALCLLELAWSAGNFRGPVGPPALGNLPLVGAGWLSLAVYWRTWRAPVLNAPAQRFWRTQTVACAASTVGLTSLLLGGDGPAERPTLAANILFVLAFALVLWGLYRLPLGGHARGERIRLLLDATTVTLAAVVFSWYFLLGLPQARLTPADAAERIVFIAVIALVVFAIIKVVFSRSTVVDPGALRLMGAALALDVVGMVAAPLLAGHPPIGTEPLARSLTYVLLVAAAVRQVRAAGPAPGDSGRGHGRTYSVLPYAAVVSVDVLLLAVLRSGAWVRAVVGASVVLLTMLVIARQLAAFRDNARLIERLAQQERRFRTLVHNAADVILILDGQGQATYVSPAIERLTGKPVDAWLMRQGFAVHEDDQALVRASFERVVAAAGAVVSYDARIAHASGDWRWVHVTHTNRLDDPAVAGIVTNVSDITALRVYHAQLAHQASHDHLTGLANRSLFTEALQTAMGHGTDRLGVALVDLDDFKTVNDTLGHHAGDALLVAAAERLQRGARRDDLVARLGGDEFAVLLTDAGPADLDAIAGRLLAGLGEPLRIDGHEVRVQASLGLAGCLAEDDAGSLLRHADIAMYEAKAAGKGRYARYLDSMSPHLDPRAQLTGDLHRALAGGEFHLHYQPIVALPGGAVTGVEALLRWSHPQRGPVPPGAFIPHAEQSGLIVPIGGWVLREACRQQAAWLAEFPETAPEEVNVNISPRQLLEPSIVEDVLAALRDAGLPPWRLVIEVTESAPLNHGHSAAVLRDLRRAGVRIALDDFGTGQSTLSTIDTCPVDQLKLDRSFVKPRGEDWVAVAVRDIAAALDVTAVAEGIETAEQAEHMHRLGYRLAQGFYFARPQPAEQIRDLLRARADATRVTSGLSAT
jgi:diguanylate cyclase (GGDEF)-like protein/PAS domain S-box-containing protein